MVYIWLQDRPPYVLERGAADTVVNLGASRRAYTCTIHLALALPARQAAIVQEDDACWPRGMRLGIGPVPRQSRAPRTNDVRSAAVVGDSFSYCGMGRHNLLERRQLFRDACGGQRPPTQEEAHAFSKVQARLYKVLQVRFLRRCWAGSRCQQIAAVPHSQ